VLFLLHFPAGFPGSALLTTLPCDVRTFLEGDTSATAQPAAAQHSAGLRFHCKAVPHPVQRPPIGSACGP
jgi:hypothetical protein